MKKQRQVGKAVILLSGGLDSATVLAMAKSDGYDLYAITFDYHQRHRKELESAGLLASAFGVTRHLVVEFNMRDIGGSALTSDLKVPKDRDELSVMHSKSKTSPAENSSQIPITYVPARNTIFLSFALGWAEALEAETIFIGANAVDYSGYPDCRPEYLKSFEKTANLATKASVEKRLRFRIKAPLIAMTKAGIIKKGIELGVDYGQTWSCYDPAERSRTSAVSRRYEKGGKPALIAPCGSCDSCRLRARGFREAGVRDPLITVRGKN